MTTAAFTGGFEFKIGDGGSSETFTTLEEVKDFGNFGITNELVNSSSFDSVNNQEYIAAALADGAEIAVICNRVHTASSQQDYVKNKVKNKQTFNVQMVSTDGTTAKTQSFAVVALGAQESFSFTEANTITFTLKITGDITES